MIRVIVHGQGGQGVKLLGEIFAHVLLELGKEVALTYDYDSNVRGGSVTAYLTFDSIKINNPIIEEADYLILLSSNELLKGKKTIIEESCGTSGCEACQKKAGEVITVPLNVLAEQKAGNKKFINMVVLGYLFNILGIDASKLDLRKFLPDKYVEENMKAIELGYLYEQKSE
ncbi:MAG: 2-oxoacid:acceptor oxidoreductase family protein [Candidatus Woesearchaeota archaeon]|jgi:Pyruvate/2-oxoacid:ferredoxin oxidoreductase gamma subunit